MDLSFPCVGDLDDGIFDVGLEHEDANARSRRQGTGSSSPCYHKSQHQSIVLSPDALDLALMAFDVGEEEEECGSGNDERGTDANAPIKSPFCDAALGRQTLFGSSSQVVATANGSPKRHPENEGSDAPVADRLGQQAPVKYSHLDCSIHPNRVVDSGCGGSAEQNQTHHMTHSPRARPGRWPPARETRGGVRAGGAGDISNAFPPRLPDLDGGSVSVPAGTSRLAAAAQRGIKAQPQIRRYPGGKLPRRSSVADAATAKLRWARQRDAACGTAVVDSSVRKEEEALAEASNAAAAAAAVAAAPDAWATSSRSRNTEKIDSSTRRTAAIEADVVGKKIVSFALAEGLNDGNDGKDSEEEEEHDDDDGRWHRKPAAKGTRIGGARGTEGEEQDDDLLARASELHSSVAGQLRSVNELLKRKSYIYIDTSWSAKQLPCPPTAWRGKALSVGGSTNAAASDTGGGGVEVGVEIRDGGSDSGSSSTVGGRHRHGEAALSEASNVMVRLEGRWASAGSKEPNVGVYSIAGEKVSKRFTFLMRAYASIQMNLIET